AGRRAAPRRLRSFPARRSSDLRGRVWSGAQARDRGLVDELGGLGDALADAARRAELAEGDYRVRYVEKEPSAFARFLEGMSSTRDRKSTRLNSSHVKISYAVFC